MIYPVPKPMELKCEHVYRDNVRVSGSVQFVQGKLWSSEDIKVKSRKDYTLFLNWVTIH